MRKIVFQAAVFFLWCAAAGAAPADIGLISPSRLMGEAGRWAILDARPPRLWRAGHIPGSWNFYWEELTRTDSRGVPYRPLEAGELAARLGAMGIDEDTPVAVYGDADRSWGGEGWVIWVLASMGHRAPLRLVDGGVSAWRAAGGELTTAAPAAGLEKSYTVRPRVELDISTEELEEGLENFSVVDTRSTFEWLRGAVPGAAHISWKRFFSGRHRRPLDAAALRALLRSGGVDLSRPVVYYCAGGVRSAWAWLVHTLAGLPPARNYEGGYEAWKRRQPGR
ncbi:MAG TPA: hypothetical protein ENJ37_09320 [Deltaproteobacteria bacterium]|nr:hypothetical protein [Deltaproteobacteria bacterium]